MDIYACNCVNCSQWLPPGRGKGIQGRQGGWNHAFIEVPHIFLCYWLFHMCITWEVKGEKRSGGGGEGWGKQIFLCPHTQAHPIKNAQGLEEALLYHSILPWIQRFVQTFTPQCQSMTCFFAHLQKGWDWGFLDQAPCQCSHCGSAVLPSGQKGPGRKLVLRVLVVSQDPTKHSLPEHPGTDPGWRFLSAGITEGTNDIFFPNRLHLIR